MSHHGLGYRIYPDDKSELPREKWVKADRYINGLEFSRDFNEAISIAKKAYRATKYPFVVVEVPLGGVRPKLCDAWIVDK